MTITGLQIDDPVVVGHLSALEPEQRVAELIAALAIGIRGLGAMGTGATAQRVGDVVERVIDDAFCRTESRIAQMLDAGRHEMGRALDPEVRSSITARMMTELGTLHRDLLDGIDPDRRDSRTARFVAELDDLLGPKGHLEQRLSEALDPNADDSALASVVRSFEQRFQELRDLIVGSGARSEEAARGTAKGFAFEDVIEARLRSEARRLGGAVVERTSNDAGTNGPGSIVGDVVVTLPNGTRLVVEAKHTARITLTGKDGILEELDRAMANRTASWAMCVSHEDAFPQEVGVFGIYGNRILVVDDGSGELVQVALRWIMATEHHNGSDRQAVDTERLGALVERLRSLATRFSRTKRGLGAVQSSVEAVRCEIDELRTELLDGVDEMAEALTRQRHEQDAPKVA